jgi:uncharacterized membrane protein
MASEQNVVLGIYPQRPGVESALEVLREAGFSNADVSVLLPDEDDPTAAAHATKAPEGLAAGATSGALIGGAFGWLTGVGALAIPGLGPFIAAGPILATLAGIGVGGAVGGLSGGLIGLGISEHEAKHFVGRIEQGAILLSVHCESLECIRKAREVLQRTGADHIASTLAAEAETDTSHAPGPRIVREAVR